MIKVLVILAIIALLVVGFLVIWPESVDQPTGNTNTTGNQTSNVNSTNQLVNSNSATPPAASSDIDVVTGALLGDASDEQSLASDEETDSALVNSDSQAASEFGESTNSNDL